MSLTPSSRNEPRSSSPEWAAVASILNGGLADRSGNGHAEPGGARSHGLADDSLDYQASFDLLQAAARSLAFLQDRRIQLEAMLRDVSERAEGAMAAALEREAEWQTIVADLQAKINGLERSLAAMRDRAELAEAQRDVQKERADQAERRGHQSEQLARDMQSSILAAFGQGSRAHEILASAEPETT